MAGKSFELIVVTPERVTYQGKAESLSLPAWEGSMGVLPGHQSALVFLKEGVVTFREGANEQVLALSGGFAEIHPKKVTLFAETAEMAQELDEERARLALSRAKESVVAARKKLSDIDVEAAQATLRRALVRLRVASTLRRGRPRHDATPRPHNEE